jgi:hypothetical protein
MDQVVDANKAWLPGPEAHWCMKSKRYTGPLLYLFVLTLNGFSRHWPIKQSGRGVGAALRAYGRSAGPPLPSARTRAPQRAHGSPKHPSGRPYRRSAPGNRCGARLGGKPRDGARLWTTEGPRRDAPQTHASRRRKAGAKLDADRVKEPPPCRHPGRAFRLHATDTTSCASLCFERPPTSRHSQSTCCRSRRFYRESFRELEAAAQAAGWDTTTMPGFFLADPNRAG